MADLIEIVVDSRRHPAEQVRALADEVGHVCLGQYREDDCWTDVDGPYEREQAGWAGSFASIVLDTRRSPIEHLGREQEPEGHSLEAKVGSFVIAIRATGAGREARG